MFKHHYTCSMKIEEAIKQTKPFKSKEQKLTVNLMYTSNWLSHKMREFFKDYGLTTKQYNILRILKGASVPVSVAFIRERLLDKVSDVSRIVDRMSSKELVKKNVCSKDKRLVDIALTHKGEMLLKSINENIVYLDRLMSGLNTKELNALNKLLDKLRSNNL